MQVLRSGTIEPKHLQALVTATEPRAVFLPPRIVRRVLANYEQGFIRFEPLRNRAHVFAKEQVLAHVTTRELAPRDLDELPAQLILLCLPPAEELRRKPAAGVLHWYWSLLFQARVHIALAETIRESESATPWLQRRIQALGRAEFAEIKQVLARNGYWTPRLGDHVAYVKFVAMFLTLEHFAKSDVPIFFPSLSGRNDLVETLSESVDVDSLLEKTRLPDAPEPQSVELTDLSSSQFTTRRSSATAPLSDQEYQRSVKNAQAAVQRGNAVRAAIDFTRIAARSTGQRGEESRQQALDSLNALANRLAAALAETDAANWLKALSPLLKSAAEGFWPPTARLLYDLQKVCVDRERGLSRIDLQGWLLSLGKKPPQHYMPALKEVFLVQHLRKAAQRLRSVQLGKENMCNLRDMLQTVVKREENDLRNLFRPVIENVLNEVGIIADNFPEQMARDKLREELLDRIVERGMLTMGEVRDAISRNQIKLKDLMGVGEFLRGDKLLQINEQLPRELEGVYHRGEFYLRGLQRMNSLLFGTPPGRFLTRYVLLPFGAAYAALKGTDAMWREVLHFLPGAEHHEPPDFLARWWSVLVLGVFLLLLIHHAAFRRLVFAGLKGIARGLQYTFHDLPFWLVRSPVLQAFWQSALFVWIRRLFLRPTYLTALVALVMLLFRAPVQTIALVSAAVFVLTAIFFATRWGRMCDEVLSERILQGWHRLSLDFFPALFHVIMDTFKFLLSEMERYLYSVDQWLRFSRRTSANTIALVGKGLVVLIWAGFAYVVRFCVILVIEPTINPIKHFPVVTVAGKLMLPVYFLVNTFVTPQFPAQWQWMISGLLFLGIVGALPGVFGFLIWELKESWRLYEANRPEQLKSTLIGSHGEHMIHFLKPGFHSGTLPKIYRKWRRAARQNNDRLDRRCRENLHHVEHSVELFLDREFVHPLHSSRSGEELELHVDEVVPAVCCIRAAIECLQFAGNPLIVAFDLRAGRLVMRIVQPGWFDQLPRDQKKLVAAMLAVLAKRAGVHLLHEQIVQGLAPLRPVYDIDDEELIVWPNEDYKTRLIYLLDEDNAMTPDAEPAASRHNWPVLQRQQIIFADYEIRWQTWISACEKHQAGKQMSLPLAESVYVYGSRKDTYEQR